MKYNKLGSSDLVVSEVCLGSMTWGMQNTEAEAHEQIDYAINRGVNFIDTAEMYPIPATHPAHDAGLSEKIIGTYLEKNPQQRSKIIIATKVMGYFSSTSVVGTIKAVWGRTDPPTKTTAETACLDTESILAACKASLRRLQTSYIDLYQLHWPDRYVPGFGQRAYDPRRERDAVPIRDTLLALKQLLDDGSIRAYGLSNETTFGVCEFCRLADELNMPRPASIQNPFCLLDRQFEAELAEACAPRNFNIGLLPWSILAGGALSGKYARTSFTEEADDRDDKKLANARFFRFPGFHARFCKPNVLRVVAEYQKVAQRHDMSCATLAQAFCKSRWYIPSSIIGATTIAHLKENLDAFDVDLSGDILRDVDAIHNQNLDVTVVS